METKEPDVISMDFGRRTSGLISRSEQQEHKHQHDLKEQQHAHDHAPTIAPGFLAAAARRTQHDTQANIVNLSRESPARLSSKSKHHSSHAPLIPSQEMFGMYVIPLEDVELKANPRPPSPKQVVEAGSNTMVPLPVTPRKTRQPFVMSTPRGTVVQFELKIRGDAGEQNLGQARTSDLVEQRSQMLSSRFGSVQSADTSSTKPATQAPAPRTPRAPAEEENERFLKSLMREPTAPRVVRIYGRNKAQVQAAMSIVDILDSPRRDAPPAARSSTPNDPDLVPRNPPPPTAIRRTSRQLEEPPVLHPAPPPAPAAPSSGTAAPPEQRKQAGPPPRAAPSPSPTPRPTHSYAPPSPALSASPSLSSSDAGRLREPQAAPGPAGNPPLDEASGYLQRERASCLCRKFGPRRYFVLRKGALVEFRSEREHRDYPASALDLGLCIRDGVSLKRSRKSSMVFSLVAGGERLKLRVADEQNADVWISALIAAVGGGSKGHASPKDPPRAGPAGLGGDKPPGGKRKSQRSEEDASVSPPGASVVTADTVLIGDSDALKPLVLSSPPSMFDPNSQLHVAICGKNATAVM